MRTNLEFRSTSFPPIPGESEEINPGRFGRRLANFIADALPQCGFTPVGIEAEDWGWRIDLQNDAFPLWIGCGNYEEYPDGFLCVIEPSTPTIRHWLRQVNTVETIERFATVLEDCLRTQADIRNLRWWSEAENARG